MIWMNKLWTQYRASVHEGLRCFYFERKLYERDSYKWLPDKVVTADFMY